MNSRIFLNLKLLFKNSKNLNKSFCTIKYAGNASLLRSKSNNQFQLVRLNTNDSKIPKPTSKKLLKNFVKILLV
jgi:hypothetical protein